MAFEPPFILALDQGTTSARAILFDRQGRRCLPASNCARSIPTGLGRARRRGHLAGSGAIVAALAQAGVAPKISPRSASPTSARRRSSGSAQTGCRWTTPSSGRTGAPADRAGCCERGHEARSARARACCSTRTSPPPSSPGCSTIPGARPGRTRRTRVRHVDSWLVCTLTAGGGTPPT